MIPRTELVWQAAFLAAGRGLRMGSLTASVPKALLPVAGGGSILEHNIANLAQARLDARVCVIGGHGWDELERCREHLHRTHPFRTVFNPAYATTGPARSMQIALEQAPTADAAIIANGDTLFSPAVFRRAGRTGSGIFLAVSVAPQRERDQLHVAATPAGFIRHARKQGEAAGPGLVSAGCLIVRGAAAQATLAAAVAEVLARERASGRQLPWHETLEVLADGGAPARALPVRHHAWSEFDTPACIEQHRRALDAGRVRRRSGRVGHGAGPGPSEASVLGL